MLGDSVVDVQYCIEPERSSRSPRVLAMAGLACLVCAATAFGISVATAAHNAAAFDEWTQSRPAYAFRREASSFVLDLVAFGGLAVGVSFLTAALLRPRVSRPGTVTLDGETFSFDEVADITGRIEAREGPASFVLRSTTAPEAERTLQIPRTEIQPWIYAAGSLALHLGILTAMSRVPVEGEAVMIGGAMEPVAITEHTPEPEDEACAPEPLDYVERSNLPPMEIDERVPDPNYVRPPDPDPQIARSQAIEAARNAGIILEPHLLRGSFASLDPDSGVFDYVNHFCTNCDPRWAVSHSPTATPGQPTRTGDYDKAIIRRYIKRNMTKVIYCYEKQLLTKPTLMGTVRVTFVIAPNGTVSSSIGEGLDEDVAICVADVIRAIEFPRPRDGSSVEVHYPFYVRLAGQ